MNFNIFDLSQLMFNCTDAAGNLNTANCTLDNSVAMLGDVFGLPATAAIPNAGFATNAPTFISLFSMMVTYFDWALVGIVGLVFSYIVIMATINTAHEGVAFGRQHNSTYTLIRAILGPVLMFPVPTSFGVSLSTLQAIVLHLVLIGVNMANIVWSHTVGAAMYMPPSQLPGPVKAMIATQGAKLYLYQAAYTTMGLDGDFAKPPTLSASGVSEQGITDPAYFNLLMSRFSGYCSNVNSAIQPISKTIANQSTTPNALCLAAVAQMAKKQSTGVLYPISAGPSLNGGTESPSLTSVKNETVAEGTAYTSVANDPTYALYSQFKFSFGNNAPFFDNGMVDIPSITFSLSPLTSVAAASQGPDNSSGIFPNPFCSASSCTGGANADPVTIMQTAVSAMNLANPKLQNSVVSIDPSNPPTQLMVACSAPDANTAADCDMSAAVDSMTHTVLQYAQAQEAKDPTPTAVSGTGPSCKVDTSITTTWSPSTGGGTQPAGTVLIPAGSSITAPFGTQPGISSTVDNAQCVQEQTTITNSVKNGVAGAPVQTVTYVLVPEQDYSQSWWYGSEVYLTITQRLADNIKTIAQAINQFSISGTSLQANALSGSKNTYIHALELDRGNFGHSVMSMTDLYKQETYTNYPNYEDQITPHYEMLPTNTADASGFSLSFSMGPGGDLTTTNIVTPTWNNTICIFDPSAPSFLDGSVSSTTTPPIQSSCFSTLYMTALEGANAQDYPAVGSAGANALFGGDQADFFSELQNVPPDYQSPIQLMIMWEIQDNLASSALKGNKAAQVANLTQLKLNIQNIIAVLKLNHVYPGYTPSSGSIGVETSTEIQPAMDVLNQMFSKVLGDNVPGEITTSISQNIGGVMGDIYSIGNQQIQDNTTTGGSSNALNSVMESSYNNIGQVQQVGIEMINAVITSLQTVYSQIENHADNFISADNQKLTDLEIASGVGMGSAAAASLVGFGASGEVMAAATQMTGLILGLKLQFEIVQQAYSMAGMLMWLPLIITTCTSLFVAGVSFAILVPIMPFILYWSGQVSWLLSVMEAVIAAPLLCLAWAVPGGHTHMGHTLSGVKVLIGVVFRPVLMVLGLFAALILTFILIKFSSQAFQIVSDQILGFANSMSSTPPTYWMGSHLIYQNNSSITEGVLAVLMLLLFCSLMVMAFNKCFSMIYMIPEKVLGWIGIQVQGTGAQDAEKLSGGVTQSAGQAAQGAGSTMTQGAQAQSQHAQGSGSASASGGQSAMKTGETGFSASKQPRKDKDAEKQ